MENLLTWSASALFMWWSFLLKLNLGIKHAWAANFSGPINSNKHNPRFLFGVINRLGSALVSLQVLNTGACMRPFSSHWHCSHKTSMSFLSEVPACTLLSTTPSHLAVPDYFKVACVKPPLKRTFSQNQPSYIITDKSPKILIKHPSKNGYGPTSLY